VNPTVTAPDVITLTNAEPLRTNITFDFPSGGFGGVITGTSGPLAQNSPRGRR